MDGTHLVRDVNLVKGDADLWNLTPVAGRLFFMSGTEHGVELWVSDGTEEGTTFLKVMTSG